MTELNCQNCKYNGDHSCAVNPNYWTVQDLLKRSVLGDSQRSAIESYLPDRCPEFEAENEMTIEITLA